MTERTDPDVADVIVVGAGSGGLTVAVGLSRLRKRVLLLEADDVGGDCTNVGCIPSKSLLHHSAVWPASGRSTGAVLEAVRRRRTALRDHEIEEFGSTPGIDLRAGRARLVGPGSVELTESDGTVRMLAAGHVVIATGSRPRRVAIDGAPDELVVTNEELFELDDVPSRLVIVGGGPIGLEMAVAFARLGTRITVLEAADQILPALLPEAAAVVRRSLERQGIEIHTGTVAHRFEPAASSAPAGTSAAVADPAVADSPVPGPTPPDPTPGAALPAPPASGSLHVGSPGGTVTSVIDDVDRILMAVGRVPNSGDLGLEALGVALDTTGRIVVDGKGRTSVPNIWACGDVTDRGGTTHSANAWGRRIIKHIVAPIAPAGAEPEHPAVAYTDPEAATIGEQRVEVPADVRRLRVAFADVDRGYTDEVDDGVIIVDVRRFSGRILGATVVGPRAGELISVFALAMKNDLPFHKWYGTVWPYPTYAAALGQLVDDYMTATVTGVGGEFVGWARGRLRRRR
jgi:dihydrolipoamide dehydrogenase